MASLTRRIAEGTFLISMSNILVTFFGFLASILLIRVLGRYEFGLLSLALSAFNIAVIFLDLGIGNVLIADAARELENKRADKAKSLLLRYVQIELLLGSVLFLAVFSSANFFAAKYNETVGTLVRISAFLLILAGVKNIFMVAFNSHSKFGYFSLMQTIEGASRLLFIFILVLVAGKGLIGVMFAYLLSFLISSVFSFPLFMKTGGYLINVKRAKENLFLNTIKGHGKYVISYQPLTTLNQNLPIWIIKYLLGVEAVGVFSVAWKMMRFVVSLLESLEQVLMPIVSEERVGGKDRISQILHRTIKYSLLIACIFLLASELLSPVVIRAIFTSKYDASITIFRVLIGVLLVSAFTIPLRPIFFSYQAQKYLFVTYLVNFVIRLALGSILTYILGLNGMALGVLLGGGIYVFISYVYMRRLFDINLEFNRLFRVDDYDKTLNLKIREKIKSIFRL